MTMLSQNDTADGWRTLHRARLAGSSTFGSYSPYGWLHDPLGRGRARHRRRLTRRAGRYHPLAPVRILDSRDGTGGFATPWGPWTANASVWSAGAGVPADAEAVVLNVTVTDTTSPRHI